MHYLPLILFSLARGQGQLAPRGGKRASPHAVASATLAKLPKASKGVFTGKKNFPAAFPEFPDGNKGFPNAFQKARTTKKDFPAGKRDVFFTSREVPEAASQHRWPR